MKLKNRVGIITGAGSGIGRALALEFARQGARVVCCGRRLDRLNETVAQIETERGTGLAVKTDVTDRQQVERLVQTTVELLRWINPSFNGRIFGVGMDFKAVAERLISSNAKDALLMRMIP